jgi:uncharacterized membrane protein YbhN (UPF0104 family)
MRSVDATSDDDAVVLEGTGRPRGRFRRVFGDIVLPIAFTVLLIVFVWRERDRLEPLTHAAIGQLVLLAVLVALTHFLNSSEFWLLYRAQGAGSGLFENWFLFLASQLGNLIPGQVGTVYRLRYMRAVHDVSYTRSAAVYGADFVATLGGAAVVALVGVLGAAVFGDGMSWVMLCISLAVGALAVAIAVLPYPRFVAGNGRIARVWRSFHAGFDQMRRDPRTAGSVVLIEIAKYLVYAWRFSIAFSLLGVNEQFWLYLVLAPAAGVAAFIAITPGALGFREAFVAASAAAMGAGLSSGLLAATADRAVLLVASIVLGAAGFLVTYPRLRTFRATRDRPPEPA